MIEAIRSLGYGVLVVDDNSPDGTGRLADQIAATDVGIDVLHRAHKAGLGPAYAAGFGRLSAVDPLVICQMDADFSHDPADLPKLVGAIQGGAELAIGSRYVPGGDTPDWPWLRRFISRGGNRYARVLLGLSTRDATAGFRAWDPAALGRVDASTAEASGYGFQVEMAWRAESEGLRVVEIPVTFRDRTRGSSKMGAAIVAEAMRLVTAWGLRRIVRGLRS